MRLTMLGTGNALVTHCYNTCFVLEEDGRHFLVDGGGGNGLIRQLALAGFDWKDMRHILVTHKHMDHVLGIFWMVRLICQALSKGSYEGDACIYSHREVTDLVRDVAQRVLTARESSFLDTRLHLVEVHDGEELVIQGMPVTFFDIGSTKATQYGFAMDMGQGRRLVCCGDEPCKPCAHTYARGCDWLLHEAFCLSGEADIFRPYEKHHSSVQDACAMTQSLGVRNLVLYHTEDTNLGSRKRRYHEEGARHFSGNLYIPDDLESLELA